MTWQCTKFGGPTTKTTGAKLKWKWITVYHTDVVIGWEQSFPLRIGRQQGRGRGHVGASAGSVGVEAHVPVASAGAVDAVLLNARIAIALHLLHRCVWAWNKKQGARLNMEQHGRWRLNMERERRFWTWDKMDISPFQHLLIAAFNMLDISDDSNMSNISSDSNIQACPTIRTMDKVKHANIQKRCHIKKIHLNKKKIHKNPQKIQKIQKKIQKIPQCRDDQAANNRPTEDHWRGRGKWWIPWCQSRLPGLWTKVPNYFPHSNWPLTNRGCYPPTYASSIFQISDLFSKHKRIFV